MLLATLVVTLGFTPDSNKKLYKAHAREFDGTIIFKGIFFKDQKVGQFIPELADKAATANNEKHANEIISKIQTKDASFFEKFKESIESGNPLEVDKALSKASKFMYQITKDNLAIKSMEKNDGGTSSYFVTAGPSEELIWVPGPLWNIVTAVYTSTESVAGLDRDKVVLYLTNQLQK